MTARPAADGAGTIYVSEDTPKHSAMDPRLGAAQAARRGIGVSSGWGITPEVVMKGNRKSLSLELRRCGDAI